MYKVRKILSFFRLLDENGDLSITNICAIIVIAKYMQADEATLSELLALLSVISGYQFKRYTQRRSKNASVD